MDNNIFACRSRGETLLSGVGARVVKLSKSVLLSMKCNVLCVCYKGFTVALGSGVDISFSPQKSGFGEIMSISIPGLGVLGLDSPGPSPLQLSLNLHLTEAPEKTAVIIAYFLYQQAFI